MEAMELINLALQVVVSCGVFFVMQTKYRDDHIVARLFCASIFLLVVSSGLVGSIILTNLLFTLGVAIWFIFNIILFNARCPKPEKENKTTAGQKVTN